jgi:hypothetical protein
MTERNKGLVAATATPGGQIESSHLRGCGYHGLVHVATAYPCPDPDESVVESETSLHVLTSYSEVRQLMI